MSFSLVRKWAAENNRQRRKQLAEQRRYGSLKLSKETIWDSLGINLDTWSLLMKQQVIPYAAKQGGDVAQEFTERYLKRSAIQNSKEIGSGNRHKWSRKVRSKRGGIGVPSLLEKGAIKNIVRPKERGTAALAVVGPKYGKQADHGHNQAHVLEKGTPRHTLWGKATRTMRPRPFLTPATTASKPAQERAIRRAIRKKTGIK